MGITRKRRQTGKRGVFRTELIPADLVHQRAQERGFYTVLEVMSLAGGTASLANIVGRDHTTITSWLRRSNRTSQTGKRTVDQKVPAVHAPAISAALGIPLSKLNPDLWQEAASELPSAENQALVVTGASADHQFVLSLIQLLPPTDQALIWALVFRLIEKRLSKALGLASSLT